MARILTAEQLEQRKKLLKRKDTIATESIEKFNEAKARVVGKTFSLYASYSDFTKSDDAKRLVKGIASDEAIDCYGDIVRFEAMKEAFDEYMKFGNIREMHGPSAVGTVKDYEFDEKNKATIIEAKIVDDVAWNKVVEGVYKGFSIGGRVIEAEPMVVKTYDKDGNEYEEWTGGLDITKLELVEISIVDRPANPDALIETYKANNAGGFMPEIAFVSKETATGETAEVEKSEEVLFDKDNAMLKEVRDNVVKFFKGQGVDIEAMSDEDKVEVSKADLSNMVKDFVKEEVADEVKEETSEDVEEKEAETTEEKSEEVEADEKAEEATVEKDETAGEVKAEGEENQEAKTEEAAEEKADEAKEETTEVEKSNVVDMKAEFAKMSELIEKKFGERLDKIEKMLSEKDEKMNEMMKKAGFSIQKEAEVKKNESIFKGLL